MILLRDILDISNNLKQSSHFKGKSGKIENCLHILALIYGLSLSHLFQGSDRRGVGERCKAQRPRLRTLQEYLAPGVALPISRCHAHPLVCHEGTLPEGVGDGGTEGHGPYDVALAPPGKTITFPTMCALIQIRHNFHFDMNSFYSLLPDFIALPFNSAACYV